MWFYSQRADCRGALAPLGAPALRVPNFNFELMRWSCAGSRGSGVHLGTRQQACLLCPKCSPHTGRLQSSPHLLPVLNQPLHGSSCPWSQGQWDREGHWVGGGRSHRTRMQNEWLPLWEQQRTCIQVLKQRATQCSTRGLEEPGCRWSPQMAGMQCCMCVPGERVPSLSHSHFFLYSLP